MKILFTGATSKQSDDGAAARARVDRIDDCTIMVNALVKNGHDVTRRRVQWGDDLSEYDLAIVGIGPFGSNNYGSMMKAVYPLTTGMPCLILHEDWKILDTVKSFKKVLEVPETLDKMVAKRWSDGRPFYEGTDHPLFDIDKVREVITKVANGEFTRLVPKFKWGDKQIVADFLGVKAENVYPVDLTPYVLQVENIEPLPIDPNREMKYMLASLADHSPWVRRLKLKHPVDYFGAKSLKAPSLANEYAVYATSNAYWGVLCPKYPHAGSGWFRMRFVYAALNKNLILLDEADAAALGIEAKRLEDFDNIEDLVAYTEIQSKAILDHLTTKETFDHDINVAVEETLAKSRT